MKLRFSRSASSTLEGLNKLTFKKILFFVIEIVKNNIEPDRIISEEKGYAIYKKDDFFLCIRIIKSINVLDVLYIESDDQI